MEWYIRNVFGTVRIIWTSAYYVTSALICLFCAQQYFSEAFSDSLVLNHRHSKLVLNDRSALEFPYNSVSNLPLMLSALPSTAGLTFEEWKLWPIQLLFQLLLLFQMKQIKTWVHDRRNSCIGVGGLGIQTSSTSKDWWTWEQKLNTQWVLVCLLEQQKLHPA